MVIRKCGKCGAERFRRMVSIRRWRTSFDLLEIRLRCRRSTIEYILESDGTDCPFWESILSVSDD